MTDRAAIQLAQRAAARRAKLALRDLEFGLSELATIASSVPFFGMALTCWQIAGTGRGMVCKSVGCGLVIYGEGISHALIPTAAGLWLAVTAYLGHRILSAQLATFETEMALAVSLLPAALYPRASSHSVNSFSPLTSVSRISRL